MLHDGVFARLVLLWAWLLGKSCGFGRLESIWFGAFARRCHDPLPLAVCGYHMVDALEPVRVTLWITRLPLKQPNRCELVTWMQGHAGIGWRWASRRLTMPPYSDSRTAGWMDRGERGIPGFNLGNGVAVTRVRLQRLTARVGVGSPDYFCVWPVFSFPCFEKDTQQAIRCIGINGGGVYRDRDWIRHAAVMKECAIPSTKDKREIHGEKEVGS